MLVRLMETEFFADDPPCERVFGIVQGVMKTGIGIGDLADQSPRLIE
jgi:hypothetical protein